MKKVYLLISFLVSFTFANAQILQIENKDGKLLELDVNNIREMRFKAAQSFDGNTPENLEIVDLGLSVNWASLNIGAENSYETGYYVSWGGLQEKEWYSWAYYEHGSSMSALEKYTKSDQLQTLQAEDDLATVTWGDAWRTPTNEEFQELMESCTIDYTAEENGVKGVRLTSNIEGYTDKSIFLPLTGWKQDNNLLNSDKLCSYWSSTVYGMFPAFAVSGEFWLSGDYAQSCQRSGTYRYLGKPVRAVTAKN